MVAEVISITSLGGIAPPIEYGTKPPPLPNQRYDLGFTRDVATSASQVEHHAVPFTYAVSWRWDKIIQERANRGSSGDQAAASSRSSCAYSLQPPKSPANRHAPNRRSARPSIHPVQVMWWDKLGKTLRGRRSGHPQCPRYGRLNRLVACSHPGFKGACSATMRAWRIFPSRYVSAQACRVLVQSE